MATFVFEGLDEFINLCMVTDKELDRIIGRSIHPGARVMASSIEGAIQAIETDDGKGTPHRKGAPMRRGPTEQQKASLISDFGIAIIRKERFGYNVKCGWDGYNTVRTARYPNGQPNAMIARSVNSGTSFMRPQHFLDRAVNSAELTTVETIRDEFERLVQRIWDR